MLRPRRSAVTAPSTWYAAVAAEEWGTGCVVCAGDREGEGRAGPVAPGEPEGSFRRNGEELITPSLGVNEGRMVFARVKKLCGVAHAPAIQPPGPRTLGHTPMAHTNCVGKHCGGGGGRMTAAAQVPPDGPVGNQPTVCGRRMAPGQRLGVEWDGEGSPRIR